MLCCVYGMYVQENTPLYACQSDPRAKDKNKEQIQLHVKWSYGYQIIEGDDYLCALGTSTVGLQCILTASY